MTSYKPVRALLRGLEVLKAVNERGTASVSAIARDTGLPSATVVRVLETLAVAGYVAPGPGGRGYRPTGKTLMLSNGFDARKRLVELALPVLERLRRRIGWPSNLAIFDHDSMVIVHTNRQPNAFSVERQFGSRSPMLVTGIGRAYLAFTGDAEREEILERLAASAKPWDRAARDRPKVDRLLGAIRRRGHALSAEEYVAEIYDSAIWAVAVPVCAGGRVEACLSALVLRSATPPESGAAGLYPALTAAARDIAKLLSADRGASATAQGTLGAG